MYDRSTFLKLNNYGYCDEDIEEVKNYLSNRELPNEIDTNVKQKDMMKSGFNLKLEMINYFIKN